MVGTGGYNSILALPCPRLESRMTTNPYEAPKSSLADAEQANDMGDFLDSPRACRAGRGIAWFAEGWELFARSPPLWIGMVLVFFAILFAISMVPFVGMLVQNVAFPILTAGLMLGCDALRRGSPLQFDHLFAGSSRQSRPLLILGLVYAGIVMAISIVALIPTVGLIAAGVATVGGDDPEALLYAVGLPVLLGLTLLMALLLPAFMAVWFAPALVILNGKQPIDAMRLSFIACVRNVVPFLLYSIVGLLLVIVASLPLMLGWLALGPLLLTSTYCAYRDIFYAE